MFGAAPTGFGRDAVHPRRWTRARWPSRGSA
jgi:hypothetical protein